MSKERKDQDQSGRASVLMQRVIALNGVLDSAKQSPKPVTGPPPLFHKQPMDLGATALEWEAQQLAVKPEPPVVTKPLLEAPCASSAPAAPVASGVTESVDAQWATYSSISLRPCDDLLSQSLLSLTIEEAVTVQYKPAAAELAVTNVSSSTDLASLDRALESAAALQDSETVQSAPAVSAPRAAAPEPKAVSSQVFVVPAPLAWTVLGLFAACLLVLGYLVFRYVM